jgi:hypothetical protein
MQRINETKSWFFVKLIEINRPLETWLKWRDKKPKSVKSEM